MTFAMLSPLFKHITKCCPCHDFCPEHRLLILINKGIYVKKIAMKSITDIDFVCRSNQYKT